tara:strand:- start:497 stop:892 length:396 start_codon:yes stop_codon:yes gene_type:complete
MLRNSKIQIGSNRNFGLVFFIVFLLIAIWPLINNEAIRTWSLLISVIFLILGLLNSKILSPLNILWFKFGLLLGSIIAPIVMGIIFFMVITPIGLLMKLLGKDLLNSKYDNKKKSYWIDRDKAKSTMKKQF